MQKTHILLNIIKFKAKLHYRAPLVWWSLYKYKCLWGVGGKGQSSSLQEGVSHIYTLRLCQSRVEILSCKKKLNYKLCHLISTCFAKSLITQMVGISQHFQMRHQDSRVQIPPPPFFFALICFELSSVVLFHPILSLVKRHHFSALNCVDWLERLYFGDNWKLND